MSNFFHKFLIVLSIFILVGSFYFYFSHGLTSEAANTPSLTSSSDASAPVVGAALGSVDEKINQDTAFLATLTSLNKIVIDPTLFSSNAFKYLKDNTVTIVNDTTVGRVNPFAPINNQTDTTSQAPSVLTIQATQITDKTAVLNGSMANIAGNSTSYFEYGPTPKLGKTTPISNQSLVGNFSFKISGLISKTAYFYKADVKVGGAVIPGEIMSFTTN